MMQIHESSSEHGTLQDDSWHNEFLYLQLFLKESQVWLSVLERSTEAADWGAQRKQTP